jgi:hypothetical protein
MFGCAATLRVDPRSTPPRLAPWLPMVCATLAVCALVGSEAAAADDAATAAATTDATATDPAPAQLPAEPSPRPPSQPTTGRTLDHRVKALSKALDLDAAQRAELREILEDRRQAVMKIWSDRALLPAERVPATHAVEERTAERIRAILNDEQKKRYNPPKPKGTQAPPANVEAWMERQALHSD